MASTSTTMSHKVAERVAVQTDINSAIIDHSLENAAAPKSSVLHNSSEDVGQAPGCFNPGVSKDLIEDIEHDRNQAEVNLKRAEMPVHVLSTEGFDHPVGDSEDASTDITQSPRNVEECSPRDVFDQPDRDVVRASSKQSAVFDHPKEEDVKESSDISKPVTPLKEAGGSFDTDGFDHPVGDVERSPSQETAPLAKF